MSAIGRKVLDLAEQQGLLDGKAIAELRKQVAESKFVITPEAIAKVLVDNGHLTPFQARKLVSQALGAQPSFHERAPVKRPPEDLTFADDKGARKPATPKSGASPLPSSPLPASPEQPAKLPTPPDGSTADDFVELEPIESSPPARGSRWRTDAPETPLAETVELSPLDMSAPPAPQHSVDVVALDDVLGPEPVAAPAARNFGGSWEAPAPPARRSGKNPWDSPLLLVGGGVLGVTLVVFALLLYALTRGSAAELFSKAEDEYRSGAYGSALAIYDQFLKRYPSDPSASLARVRHGMAQLRQVADDGRSPRQALATAQQVLPQIEAEEKFGEARSELATILPDIADSLAVEAAQADETAGKQQLVKLTSDALTLVNNPSYLPASLRKERESRIARIIDKLQGAERGIQQDKDLADAIEKIGSSIKGNDAAAAYQIRAELLRKYPALEANPELSVAIRQVGEKERELVKATSEQIAAQTSDRAAGSERVVISHREGPTATAALGQPIFALIEGSVYGFDATTGRVLWRRFVGYETTAQPLALTQGGKTDAVLLDARQKELVRLSGTTGELVWRQELKESAAQPILAGGRILATTRSGRILAIDAATGQVVRAAQLPQKALVAAANDARPGSAPASSDSRLFQLGEHSTLFVLEAASLACTETFYLGHKAGAVLTPPLVVLDHLLVVESPADDLSTIRVLGPDPKTKRLIPVGRTFRLKGRVVQPLAVARNRVAAVTDLGQVAVYEVDPSNAREPVRQIAGLDASESAPQPIYCALDGNRLWVAHRRRMLFEIQTALQQLARKETENHDDVFLAPLQLHGDKLFDVRRREGVSSALVEGCQSGDGRQVWTTHVAAPIVALAASESRQAVDALTQGGRLYALKSDSFQSGHAERPTFASAGGNRSIFSRAISSADGQSLVWTETKQGGRAFLYDLASGKSPTAVSLPAPAAAPAQRSGAGLLAPLANGSVSLVSPAGGAAVSPFLPPLAPGELPRWTQPAIFAGGNSFVISDGRGMVYAVGKKEQPQPHLAALAESRQSGPVISPLVVSGAAAIGIMRLDSGDAVAGFDAQGAAAFEPVTLQGRVQAGPFAVGGLVFVAAEPDGLVCVEASGKVRWRQLLVHGPVAGPLLATPGADLLLIYQSGIVARLDATTGQEVARHDVGQPLGGAGCLLGEHLFVAGSDGTVHRISLPARQ